MKVTDYIQGNHPFYHITAKENVKSIQNKGLLKKRCNAICVVRTDNPDIINEIATTQLGLCPGTEATIIKIWGLMMLLYRSYGAKLQKKKQWQRIP